MNNNPAYRITYIYTTVVYGQYASYTPGYQETILSAQTFNVNGDIQTVVTIGKMEFINDPLVEIEDKRYSLQSQLYDSFIPSINNNYKENVVTKLQLMKSQLNNMFVPSPTSVEYALQQGAYEALSKALVIIENFPFDLNEEMTKEVRL